MPEKASLPTIDELVALLSRTSLPTVIIEGQDDVIVYRKMEEEFAEFGVSVLPVGGRINVLKIYDKLIGSLHRKKLIFIADLDLWVISNVPEKYVSENLIFTDGYSIENDVFRDLDIKGVMTKDEKTSFDKDLSRFSYWYSLAVKRNVDEEVESDLSLFPGRILDDPLAYDLHTKLKLDEQYPAEILSKVENDYFRFIRGKSLMHLAYRQLGRAGRDQKIPMGSFMGIAPSRRGPLLENIFERVRSLIE